MKSMKSYNKIISRAISLTLIIGVIPVFALATNVSDISVGGDNVTGADANVSTVGTDLIVGGGDVTGASPAQSSGLLVGGGNVTGADSNTSAGSNGFNPTVGGGNTTGADANSSDLNPQFTIGGTGVTGADATILQTGDTPLGGNPGSSGGSSYSSGGSVQLFGTTNSTSAFIPGTCPLITDYLKAGSINDIAQVTKLQSFLKNVEKLNVDVNGVFDQKTEDAVKAFQTKYLASVMGPWDATRATGLVYITTLKKINELACASPFTLSADEQAIIKAYKDRTAETEQTAEIGQQVTPVASSTLEVGTDDESNVAAVGRASILSRFWNFIKNLFR